MSQHLYELSEQLQPEHTALLIIDIQNDFCAPGGFMDKVRNYALDFVPDVVSNIEQVAAALRQLGVLVVWVRSHYDFKYINSAHISKRRIEGCALEGTWGAEFYGEGPQPEDLVVDKHHFSGFHDTGLHAALQERGIRTLILAGVATNVCVDSTLRDGFFLNYHIVLLEDCVGSNSAVGHEGTLATVRNNIGSVVDSNELVRMLGR